MGTPASRVTTHLSFAEQTHQALAKRVNKPHSSPR
jgi:hypothetical protein